MKGITPFTVIKMITDAIESNAENPLPFGSRDSYDYEYSSSDTYISKSNHGGLKKSEMNTALRGLEDRKNDWLARQIREENRVLRSGTLSDLGARHHVKCDADDIKKIHHILHLMGKEEM